MPGSSTLHFWLGRFPNEERVKRYFDEVWDPDDEDREHTPLSEFGRDQGRFWYDHDFLEHGYREDPGSIAALVEGHSWHEQWATELSRRAAEAGLTSCNTVVFIDQDQIDSPQSITGADYRLHYLGTIRVRH